MIPQAMLSPRPVGPALKADDTIGLLAQCGEHHDRDGPAGPQLPADLEAVNAGQHQVQDDQVRRLFGDSRGPTAAGQASCACRCVMTSR
jgi:hypothetical protein